MKTNFLLAVILISHFSFTQTFSLGPDVGMNLIKTEKTKLGANYQPAWYAGVMSMYKINDWFSIKAGITYNQKIKTYASADTTISPTLALLGLDSINGIDLNTYSTTKGRQSLNFVQMPIMASFTLNNLSFNVGGYIGYMFNSRAQEVYNERTPFMSTFDISSIDPTGIFVASLLPPPQKEEFTEISNASFINRLDFGIKTGLSYSIHDFSINLSYLYGFKNYSSQYTSTVNLNHHYFQISISSLFEFGKNKSFSRG